MQANLKSVVAHGIVLLLVTACGKPSGGQDESAVFGIGPDTGNGRLGRSAPLVRERMAQDSKKKSALIFYFADTAEPYMQGSVAHELRALRETCATKSADVNWVAFINSFYEKSKSYLQCKGGVFSEEAYDIANLDAKVAALTSEDFDPALKDDDARTKLFDVKLALKHGKALNKEYKKQVFVHPEIMKSIMAHAMSKIFPPKDFAYFVTIKGHGGKTFALTGLTSAQLEKKTAEQLKALEELKVDLVAKLKDDGALGREAPLALDAQLNKAWLGQLRPRSKAQHDLNADQPGLNADQPGLNADQPGLNVDIPGLNADQPGLNADQPGLNADQPGLNADVKGLNADIPGLNADVKGLNADIQGLGVEGSGLSADNHFGMSTEIYFTALGAAIAVANNGTRNAELAFLNMESCESRVRGEIGGANPLLDLVIHLRPAFKAGYSADGSLWYRSYDWNNILFNWLKDGPTPAKLQTMMIDLSGKVPNFVYD